MRTEAALLTLLLALSASAAAGAASTKDEPDAPGEIRVEVDRVLRDPRGSYVVLLCEEEGERVLPIWIGPF